MGQFEINRHMEKSPNKVGITVIYVKFGMVLRTLQYSQMASEAISEFFSKQNY